MKKVLVLLFVLLMLIFYGCTPASDTQPNTTASYSHTYEVLQNEYDRILEYLELAYSGDLITTIYIDHSESVIVVGLKELNDENIKFFKDNISNEDFIVFEEGVSFY